MATEFVLNGKSSRHFLEYICQTAITLDHQEVAYSGYTREAVHTYVSASRALLEHTAHDALSQAISVAGDAVVCATAESNWRYEHRNWRQEKEGQRAVNRRQAYTVNNLVGIIKQVEERGGLAVDDTSTLATDDVAYATIDALVTAANGITPNTKTAAILLEAWKTYAPMIAEKFGDRLVKDVISQRPPSTAHNVIYDLVNG